MIELLTANTPNGKKISIMLEEINFDYKIKELSDVNKIEINVFNLISDNNAHDLTTDNERNGEFPDGTSANWASRLPNNAGFYATAYEMDMSTGLSTDNSFFLSYDFDTLNAGTQAGVGNAVDDDYTYYIYGVNSNSDDPNDGHSFDVVTSVESAGQYLYFASQYAGDYNPQVPGLEVLVTGMMYYDMDGDGTAETPMNGIRAVTVTGAGANYTATPVVVISGGLTNGNTPTDTAKAYANFEFGYQDTVDSWHETMLDTISSWKSRYKSYTLEEI